MLIEKEGNLLDYYHRAYAHGVNNKGIMNAVIAVEFRNRYPDMYKEYQELCKSKLLIPGKFYLYLSPNNQYIFNLVTQDNLQNASMFYLEKSIYAMWVTARDKRIKDIAIPLIAYSKGRLTKEMLLSALHPFIKDSEYHITLYT